jgi:hypothetical protein
VSGAELSRLPCGNRRRSTQRSRAILNLSHSNKNNATWSILETAEVQRLIARTPEIATVDGSFERAAKRGIELRDRARVRTFG